MVCKEFVQAANEIAISLLHLITTLLLNMVHRTMGAGGVRLRSLKTLPLNAICAFVENK